MSFYICVQKKKSFDFCRVLTFEADDEMKRRCQFCNLLRAAGRWPAALQARRVDGRLCFSLLVCSSGPATLNQTARVIVPMSTSALGDPAFSSFPLKLFDLSGIF